MASPLALAPADAGREAALTPSLASKLMVLRKAPLVVGNAPAAFSRDFPLLVRIHRCKPPVRGANVLSHGSALDRIPLLELYKPDGGSMTFKVKLWVILSRP
jgi:hypothetical protein